MAVPRPSGCWPSGPTARSSIRAKDSVSVDDVRRPQMRVSRIALIAAIAVITTYPLLGQEGQAPGRGQGGRGQGGRGQGGPPAPPSNLPSTPTAVALPTLSAEVTGPGPIFDSVPSLPPGKGLSNYGYEAKEYFVSGTANGQPYKT